MDEKQLEFVKSKLNFINLGTPGNGIIFVRITHNQYYEIRKLINDNREMYKNICLQKTG